MTEIPEHLLKRSRERRSALGLPVEGGEAAGGGSGSAGGGGGDAPAAATPAPSGGAATPAVARPAAAARPTPSAPPPPKPDPPYVAAAKRRRKVPLWAMPVLALLPVWVFIYAEAMKPPEVTVTGPLAAGATIYASKCSSCHGAAGEGGVGYELNAGEVLKTFPRINDQLSFVYTGNKPYDGKPYGDPARPGGPHIGGQQGAAGSMPAWGLTAGGELTDLELLEVICHERITLAGEDPASAEAVDYCTPEGTVYNSVVAGGFAEAGIPIKLNG